MPSRRRQRRFSPRSIAGEEPSRPSRPAGSKARSATPPTGFRRHWMPRRQRWWESMRSPRIKRFRSRSSPSIRKRKSTRYDDWRRCDLAVTGIEWRERWKAWRKRREPMRISCPPSWPPSRPMPPWERSRTDCETFSENTRAADRPRRNQAMVCPICRKDHPETDAQALSILTSTPRRLEKLAASMTPREAAARPVPKKWSAKEVIAHLADGEIIYGLRYRKIPAEPGAPLVAFDQDVWAKELPYRKQALKPTLQSFLALRKQNLAVLKLAPKGAWTQVAPHPEYGTLSLRELVVHLAHHDRNHAAQVERIATAMGKSKRTKKSTKKKHSRKPAPTGRARGKRRQR